MSTTPNIVMDKGGSNQHTVYSTKIDDIITKKLLLITPPNTSANWGSGPKVTKIVDLQRIEERWNVTGHINEADRQKHRSLIKAGGTFIMEVEGEDFDVNFEKTNVTKGANREDDHRDVIFSVVVGEDL